MIAYYKKVQASNQQFYHFENYKSKNPRLRSQWQRQQIRRKDEREYTKRANAESSSNVPFKKDRDEGKKLVGRKLFLSQKGEFEDKSK